MDSSPLYMDFLLSVKLYRELNGRGLSVFFCCCDRSIMIKEKELLRSQFQVMLRRPKEVRKQEYKTVSHMTSSVKKQKGNDLMHI